MPFPWFSVAGLVVVAFLVFKHRDWVELFVGKALAAWLVIAAALVVLFASSYHPTDFADGFSWIINRSVSEIQPWIDDALRAATRGVPTTTTTTTTTVTLSVPSVSP